MAALCWCTPPAAAQPALETPAAPPSPWRLLDQRQVAATISIQLLDMARPEGILSVARADDVLEQVSFAFKEPEPTPPDPIVGLEWFENHAPAVALCVASQLAKVTGPGNACSAILVDPELNQWMTVTHDFPVASSEPPQPQPENFMVGPLIDLDQLIGVEDSQPIMNSSQNRWEASAYNYLVVRAREIPPEILAKRSDKTVTFAHMFNDPPLYRGELIHIEGTVRRITKYKAPSSLKNDGVEYLYEAWIYQKPYFNYPICIIVTEIPPELEKWLGQSLDDTWISFDGFFFKLYRYESAERVNGRPQQRLAPLLIGRSFQLISEGAAAAQPSTSIWGSFTSLGWIALLGLVFVASIIAVSVSFIWLSWQRDDQLVQMRLRQAQLTNYQIDGEDTEKHAPDSPAELEADAENRFLSLFEDSDAEEPNAPPRPDAEPPEPSPPS
ncbi:MAG: hypothetical protein ACK4RK_07155 [Gemmataceae bacterium]